MKNIFVLPMGILALAFFTSTARAEALSFHLNSAAAVITLQQHAQPKNVQVEIDGVALKGITQVDASAGGTVEYKDPEDMTTRYRPGNNKTGRITITREWSNDTTFYSWMERASSGKAERRSITVVILADDGTTAKLELSNVTPVGWSGPAEKSLGSAHATESLTCVYENFDYKK